MKRAAIFLTLVMMIGVALAGVAPTATRAQDDVLASPLHALLALVPEAGVAPELVNPRWGLSISYVDYQTIAAARPGVPVVANWAEFDAVLDSDARDLWLANRLRAVAGDDPIQRARVFNDEFAGTYGFDFFDIHQSMNINHFPHEAQLYGGDFDLAAIEAAFTARTYAAHTINGVEIWCGPIGCENGNDILEWLPDQEGTGRDPQTLQIVGGNRFPIFGGRDGKQQPIALMPSAIASSPNWDVMQMIMATIKGDAPALLDVPRYRALADVITSGEGQLLQVWFGHPAEFTQEVGWTLGEDTDLLTDHLPALDHLPKYSLAAVVDWQAGADQVHGVAAVYANEADATRAAEELTIRLADMISVSDLRAEGEPVPLIAWDTIQATVDAPRVVHHAGTDYWIALASVRYPLPDNTPDAEGHYAASGELYYQWWANYRGWWFTPLFLPRLY